MKIRANFYNALASGAGIAGAAVPTFAVYTGSPGRSQYELAAVVLCGAFLAFAFHQSVLYHAAQIED